MAPDDEIHEMTKEIMRKAELRAAKRMARVHLLALLDAGMADDETIDFVKNMISEAR
ncbi:hypothetical protein VTJ49DRAFT_3521 [Mycothermus thermophilus]|uniref:Uncharacterized protein n=1 Tax=Humicola insolens TaxID=85995 RepID=A0ABR3V897_HUMIN